MTAPVGKSLLLYAASFAVAGATPFILLPVLTSRLTTAEFGQVTSFLIATVLFSNLAGLSAHGFVSVRFFKLTSERFATAVTGSILLVLAGHALMLLLAVIMSPLLERLLGLSAAHATLAVVAALFLNINLMSLAIFQSSGRPGLYFFSRLLQAAIEIGMCLVLLRAFPPGPDARVFSYVMAVAVSSIASLIFCAHRGHVAARAEPLLMKEMLRFGVSMLPHIVAGTAISYIDRVVVSSQAGLAALGMYMAAMQVGMIVVALIEPLNKALAPWLFSQLARNDSATRRMIVTRTYQLFATLMLAGLLLTLFADAVFGLLVGPEFGGARPLIPWIIAGFVLQGMYYAVVNYMFYAERTGILSLVTASVAAAGALISFGLVSIFGVQGASASFLINNALLFLLVWLAASRVVRMPWRLWLRHEPT